MARRQTFTTLIRVKPILFVLICCIPAMVSSCRNPYPGYTGTDDGIYYKLLAIGEQNRRCNYGDYVTANVVYTTMNDSVFFSGTRTFQLTKPDFPGSIDKCFTMIGEQDSARFIISALDFFEKTLESTVPDYLAAGGKMKIAVKLLEIQTGDEYARKKEVFLQWIEDLGEYEKVLLQQYLNREKIDVPPTEDGIYYVEQQAGNGPAVTLGDTVTLHYEGYLLNGRFFDSTRKRNEPFQFVYGQQWQVIGGLEKAVGRMREGGKSLVIVPSEQAFGSEGSAAGIVPPFTPVIFEIELINVK
jgi:FKBP-type peptidyl-prolyl cis-trans isomerase